MMKNKSNLMMMIVAFLFVGKVVFGQAALEKGGDLDISKVLETTSIKVGKMDFPKPAPPPKGAKMTTQSCCTIGETKQTNGVARLDMELPKGTNKNKTRGPEESIYATSSCWVITGYQRFIESQAGGSFSASEKVVPANYSYISNSEYKKTFEELRDYVLKANILDKYKVDIILKLQTYVSNYSQYAQSLSVSNASVIHKAEIGGAGLFNGRSWYKGYVNVTETCCPTEIRNPVDLNLSLRAWTDDVISKIPKKKMIDTTEVKKDSLINLKPEELKRP
jgi:hypothetical protein